ncbi:MAG: putative MPP superfamily phosphohydrolase [Paracoccaceae bacterium]|jgi:predicted MPP superfamily phosphohydrolase
MATSRPQSGAPKRQRRVKQSKFEHSLIRPVFRAAFRGLEAGLKITGLHARGQRNAADTQLNRFDIALDGLPAAFDGYTILHMSDLHADGPIDLEGSIERVLDGVDVDLCALTGDYRYRLSGSHEDAAAPMARIVKHVRARDGIFGIMGNHDLGTMIAPLERAGIRMLVNDHIVLRRGDDEVQLVGLDDVHAYQPAEEAAAALATMPDGFRILLQHSPELLDEAQAANVSLYLCGHTHGGQICLPGGIPVMTNIRTPRRYASGLWKHGEMTGYTTVGVGVSIMPLRFFSKGEIALITLRRA